MTGVAVALVHSVNPFGFHRGRRFNENNVDLNRNVLPEHTHPGAFAALSTQTSEETQAFDNFLWLLQPDKAWVPWVDDAMFYGRAVYMVAAYGFLYMKRVLVTGQYHQPNAPYYGGDKLQPRLVIDAPGNSIGL